MPGSALLKAGQLMSCDSTAFKNTHLLGAEISLALNCAADLPLCSKAPVNDHELQAEAYKWAVLTMQRSFQGPAQLDDFAY